MQSSKRVLVNSKLIKPMSKFQNRMVVCLFVIDMFFTMMPWFVLTLGNIKFIITFSLSALIFFSAPQSFNVHHGKIIVILIFYFLAVIFGTYGNLFAYIGRFLVAVPFVLFIMSTTEIHDSVLRVFRISFLTVISISLPFWIMHLLGVSMPYNIIYIEGNTEYVYLNYYVFVHGIAIEDFFPRFCSIFTEPGYVACFIAFFLYLDKYNFRKLSNWIFVVALILTFSLAGWIFFFLGLVPYLFLNGKKSIRYIILTSAVIAVFFIVSSDKDSVVYEMIGSRLEIEDGEMKGYNRSNDELDYIWENRFIGSSYMMLGMREQIEKYDFGASVDMRMYMVRYGVLAAVLYILFLLICFSSNKSKQGAWFALMVLLFAYRGYTVMFWDALLFLYIAVLERFKRESNCKDKKSLLLINENTYSQLGI